MAWNNPPFYISAYGIARKHGYTGSEDKWLADMKYPVGAIYLSTEETNPGVLFGGTWVQIENKLLITAGETHTAGNTYQVGRDITVSGASYSYGVYSALCVYAWKRTK